ncbi:PREDICTED: probable beta-1,4-xylosyltransferase IRX14 [Tarenaya hassleriana]|uniref:probable beta-1,4-xylosyltransferase IRX14 n=1 Tax=Tarenaya hassleriana TaxID=28532 RepID=UPI00053C28BA|nr:PREDICTED: probable beta-1,4-xylosyltransferase IRX14 [Tarenaya hassleriana]
MKLSALHQSYLNRRSNSFRSPPPLDSTADGSGKSPAALFWLFIHCLCCLISLVLGFRFSRLVFFLFFSISSTTLHLAPLRSDLPSKHIDVRTLGRTPEPPALNATATSSRVVVGRHGIRIRPWPHPNPVEVMKAHQIIERVQREQRTIFGVKSPRRVIAVTPTYVRTFQALHLTGVMHSLMLVPYDLVWIVVEAGGATNETASIVSKSGLRTIHVGFEQRMPNTWEDRSKLEVMMRLRALRVVREEKLDGIVMFADDSNMHSMELFDEIQTVKWFGAISVGILVHSGNAEEMIMPMEKRREIEESSSLPVQGPACNSSDKLVGWHTFNTLPYAGKSAVYIDDMAEVLPQKLEWSGFVLNSRLFWEDAENRPEWVKDFGSLNWNDDIENPLSLLKDTTMVEPVGSCGRQVLLWWLRVEARADSKFPPGWIIDPPLEITVPAKRTPWPDTPPELPSNTKPAITSQENTPVVSKHSTKTRRSRHRSKRKHEPKPTDTQLPSKQSSPRKPRN